MRSITQNQADSQIILNNYSLISKLKRTVLSVMPISPDRKGKYRQCGACCQILWKCPFLRKKGKKKYYCAIYRFRPFFCRKYPRIVTDLVTQETFGFRFQSNMKVL